MKNCPKCKSPDYHPDPSGPNGETVWICETCSYQYPSATAFAAAKIAKPKKTAKVSHAKAEQAALPLPASVSPEFGLLALERIEVAEQVRREFDPVALEELAADIAQRGIMQPLTVRKTDTGFLLIAGERRLRAAKLAQLEAVPCLVIECDEREHRMAQIAENIQRQDLTLREEAEAIKALYEELGTVKAVGERLHKSISWVSKRLAVAKDLGSYAAALLADGITEDLELILAVNKLDEEYPGSNATWALCQKIRKGEAGREDAREALRRATEPKKTGDEPQAPRPAAEPDPMQTSKYFREWLRHPSPWAPDDYLDVLWQLNKGIGADTYRALKESEDYHRQQMQEAQRAALEHVRQFAQDTCKASGDLMQHEAWVQFAKSKDPHNDLH